MPNYTENLNLYKVDPTTDGENTFNIDTILNANWDKMDEFAGAVEEGLKQFNFEAWANMPGATYTEEIQDDGSYINTLKINNVLKATRQSYPINTDGKFITVEQQYVDGVLIQTRTLTEWEENGIMKMEVV